MNSQTPESLSIAAKTEPAVKASSCCSPAEQEACCEPEAKSSCCGAAEAPQTPPREACGCR